MESSFGDSSSGDSLSGGIITIRLVGTDYVATIDGQELVCGDIDTAVAAVERLLAPEDGPARRQGMVALRLPLAVICVSRATGS